MKKIGIASVAMLLATVGLVNLTNKDNKKIVNDLESSTTDVINEKSNVKKVALKNASSGNDAFNASKIYFQTAQDSEGYEYLRFATALRGSYSRVSYTRHIDGLGDNDSNVSVLYKGIAADGKVSYYDGSGLVDHDVTSTENYYWACYTIRFKSNSTYKDSDITLTLNVDDKYTDSHTISLNNAKNYVEDNADITINELKTYRMEAENLDFSKATLRDDFANAGRTFIETPTVGEASGGKSICGYKPGSVFEISLNLLKESTLYITSSMSDTETNYTINDGVKFEMDSTLMTAEDMSFTFHGHPNYWEWKEVVIGKITLPAGEHTFKMTSVSRRPNIDYFDFEVLKYGNQEKEKVLEELVVGTLPTKTKYEAGEIFDPTGMVIKAKYSDYTYVDVTDYTIDKTGPLSAADTGITVSYEGKTVIVPIEVGKSYDVTLATLGDHIFEAENIKVDDNWILRSDMAGFGRNFSISNSTASGGKSIERYDVGTKMTIEFYVGEDSTLALQIVASNYTNFTFDEKVEVKIDDTILVSNNPTLGHRYDYDYWNWVNVKFEEKQLTKGDHVLTINMKAEHPNLDFVNFRITKYGDKSVVLDNVYNKNSKVATVVKEGLVTVEAEEMNVEHWKRASAFDANVQEMATASNGKYLAASSGSAGGNKNYYAEFKINMDFAGKVEFSAAYVQPEGKKTIDMDMTRLYAIMIDGNEVSLDSTKTTLAAREDATVWDVFNYNLINLDAGEHTVRIELKENLSYAPNIDYVKFDVKKIKTIVNEAGRIKLEAEEMDLSNLVSDGRSLIEEKKVDATSGTGSLGHIVSGYIDIDFNVTFASTLTMQGLFSKYEAHSLKDKVEFKLDGVVVDYDDITLGRAEDGSNDWFNWKEATINFGDLASGVHTLTINFKQGCNFDCATLEFAAK